jgi:KaiC/GvpD/RAD55 family RecA-like ATPase
MYDLGPPIDAHVDAGTNLLLSGPPLSGKRSLALNVLGEGSRNGEGSIIVTTKDSGDRVLENFASSVEGEIGPVAVVDCVTKQQGAGSLSDDDRIRYVSSPVDMTGIGIQLSEFLQEFYQDRGVHQNRVMLYSLSTLLMYSDLQTVFRFLHVFTGRIQSIGGLGLFAIDSTAHEDKTVNTLKQLFDGLIELSESGDPSLRLPDQ